MRVVQRAAPRYWAMAMAVFTVLGAGMMGSALCVPLVDRGHDVRLVGTHLDGDIVDSLRATGVHPRLQLELPRSIVPYSVDQIAAAMTGADVIALGVSSADMAWACEKIAPYARVAMPLLMITKGLSWNGRALEVLPDVVGRAMPEAVRDAIAPAAIAGPCIAGELARRVPSCVVITCRDPTVLDRIAGLVCTDYYHVRTSTDVVGTQACAALKNAYAMGIAFATGMNERAGGAPGSIAMHNLESAIFAQAVREMQILVACMGGDAASVVGLAGVGDLDVTTNGGRTGLFGKLLGLGLTVAQAVERMEGATLECLEILAVMREATRVLRGTGELAVESLPLLDHMAEVALDGAPVRLPLDAFFR